MRPVIDCEPRAANGRHYTVYFYIPCLREDATEEKRVSDARCRPRYFLIPESWAARGKLSTAALNFSRTFLIYTWHQHTAEQSTSLPRSSVGPPLAELLLILAGLSVGRFSRSFRLFALCWIYPACPVHPSAP